MSNQLILNIQCLINKVQTFYTRQLYLNTQYPINNFKTCQKKWLALNIVKVIFIN